MSRVVRKVWVLTILSLLLAAGGVVQWSFLRIEAITASDLEARMADILPREIKGWSVRDEPIAATTEMQRAVSELLNYDDAVCRVYANRDIRLTVYVAAWAPGKMSPRLVAGHTPDICWPAAGWVRIDSVEFQPAQFNEFLAQRGLQPGSVRTFSSAGLIEYVAFWHRVGDVLFAYRSREAPPWWAIFADVWRDGLKRPSPQRFVRISANVALSTILDREELIPLIMALHKLGLAAL